MKNFSVKKLLVTGIFVVLFATFSAIQVNAAYVISSLDVQVSPAGQTAKIGDYLLFQMAVINASTTYSNVHVVTATATTVVITGSDFPAGSPGNMVLYDDTHTWIVNAYTDITARTVTLDEAPGRKMAGRAVSNYMSLASATFKASDGTLVTGGSPTLDILPALNGIAVFDDGDALKHNDTSGGDGIWNAKYMIREISGKPFETNQLTIRGHYFDGATSFASNDGLQIMSNPAIKVDGVRPVILNIDPNPSVFNPDKQFMQIFYSLTEQSMVKFKILDGATTVREMAATGYSGVNQPITWDGLDNNGDMVIRDRDYDYQFDITDVVGNTGASATGRIKTTSVELENSMFTIDTQYNHQDPESEVAVIAEMTFKLKNATKPNLQNLGFDYTYGETATTHDYMNYPYIKYDFKIYDSAGAQISANSRDTSALDMDQYYMDLNNDRFFACPKFFDGWDITGRVSNTKVPFVYAPVPVVPCNVTNTVIYTEPDGNDSNDWDNTFAVTLNDPTGAGDYTLSMKITHYMSGMTPGNYITAFRGQLVGKELFKTNSKPLEGAVDCTTGTVTSQVKYYYDTYHVAPSFFSSDGFFGDERGYGLCSQNIQSAFIIEQDVVIQPLDKTPPTIVKMSEYPTNGSTVSPGTISKLNPISVTLTDDGVGHGSSNNSKIELYNPSGNKVGGTPSWTGVANDPKSWVLIFTPDADVVVGGVYTVEVTPVDAANNIGPKTVFSFTVYDTLAPIVNNVNVKSSSNGSQNLSGYTDTQINFLVSSVEATLIPAGTSPVDWTASSIRVSGVAGTVAHDNGTNVIRFIPSSTLVDAHYTVIINAVSVAQNGNPANSATYTYTFYITTSGVVYVDISGTDENPTTYMRILTFDPLDSGISENGGVTNLNPATDITVASVASPPPAPTGQTIMGGVVSFSLSGSYSLPAVFDANKCSAILRMHITVTDYNNLLNLGLTSANLKLYVWDGVSWTQITTLTAMAVSGTDRYFEAAVTSIPANNRYALAYTPPAIPVVPHHFDNTKIFNPAAGPAKIYYTDDISDYGAFGGSGNVKLRIYSLTGTLVRTMEYQNAADYPLFTSYDANPLNALDLMYYAAWDGKNDKGALVKNGLYVIKIEKTTITGVKSSSTRAVAVVK